MLRKMTTQIIIDGSGAVLGRLAAHAAKQALLGKNVIIVNCNEILISGDKRGIVQAYLHARRRGRGSQKGPHISKVAEKITKRTIRGMLSYTQQRGWDAYKRVLCYNETPKEFEAAKKISILKEIKTNTIKLKELSKLL